MRKTLLFQGLVLIWACLTQGRTQAQTTTLRDSSKTSTTQKSADSGSVDGTKDDGSLYADRTTILERPPPPCPINPYGVINQTLLDMAANRTYGLRHFVDQAFRCGNFKMGCMNPDEFRGQQFCIAIYFDKCIWGVTPNKMYQLATQANCPAALRPSVRKALIGRMLGRKLMAYIRNLVRGNLQAAREAFKLLRFYITSLGKAGFNEVFLSSLEMTKEELLQFIKGLKTEREILREVSRVLTKLTSEASVDEVKVATPEEAASYPAETINRVAAGMTAEEKKVLRKKILQAKKEQRQAREEAAGISETERRKTRSKKETGPEVTGSEVASIDSLMRPVSESAIDQEEVKILLGNPVSINLLGESELKGVPKATLCVTPLPGEEDMYCNSRARLLRVLCKDTLPELPRCLMAAATPSETSAALESATDQGKLDYAGKLKGTPMEKKLNDRLAEIVLPALRANLAANFDVIPTVTKYIPVSEVKPVLTTDERKKAFCAGQAGADVNTVGDARWSESVDFCLFDTTAEISTFGELISGISDGSLDRVPDADVSDNLASFTKLCNPLLFLKVARKVINAKGGIGNLTVEQLELLGPYIADLTDAEKDELKELPILVSAAAEIIKRATEVIELAESGKCGARLSKSIAEALLGKTIALIRSAEGNSGSSRKKRETQGAIGCADLDTIPANFRSQQELMNMNTTVYTECPEKLNKGNYTLSQLQGIGENLMQYENQEGPLTVDQQTSLGVALLGVFEKSRLNLTSDSVVTAIASKEVNPNAYECYVNMYSALKTNRGIQQLSTTDLQLFGRLLCGTSPIYDLETAANSYRTAAKMVGSVECFNSGQATSFVGFAKQFNGADLSTWTIQQVQDAGSVLKAATPAEKASLSSEVISSISTKALKHFTAEDLNAISDEKLNELTTAQCLVIKEEILSSVTEAKRAIINNIKNGLPGIPPQTTTTQGQTTSNPTTTTQHQQQQSTTTTRADSGSNSGTTTTSKSDSGSNSGTTTTSKSNSGSNSVSSTTTVKSDSGSNIGSSTTLKSDSGSNSGSSTTQKDGSAGGSASSSTTQRSTDQGTKSTAKDSGSTTPAGNSETTTIKREPLPTISADTKLTEIDEYLNPDELEKLSGGTLTADLEATHQTLSGMPEGQRDALIAKTTEEIDRIAEGGLTTENLEQIRKAGSMVSRKVINSMDDTKFESMVTNAVKPLCQGDLDPRKCARRYSTHAGRFVKEGDTPEAKKQKIKQISKILQYVKPGDFRKTIEGLNVDGSLLEELKLANVELSREQCKEISDRYLGDRQEMDEAALKTAVVELDKVKCGSGLKASLFKKQPAESSIIMLKSRITNGVSNDVIQRRPTSKLQDKDPMKATLFENVRNSGLGKVTDDDIPTLCTSGQLTVKDIEDLGVKACKCDKNVINRELAFTPAGCKLYETCKQTWGGFTNELAETKFGPLSVCASEDDINGLAPDATFYKTCKQVCRGKYGATNAKLELFAGVLKKRLEKNPSDYEDDTKLKECGCLFSRLPSDAGVTEVTCKALFCTDVTFGSAAAMKERADKCRTLGLNPYKLVCPGETDKITLVDLMTVKDIGPNSIFACDVIPTIIEVLQGRVQDCEARKKIYECAKTSDTLKSFTKKVLTRYGSSLAQAPKSDLDIIPAAEKCELLDLIAEKIEALRTKEVIIREVTGQEPASCDDGGRGAILTLLLEAGQSAQCLDGARRRRSLRKSRAVSNTISCDEIRSIGQPLAEFPKEKFSNMANQDFEDCADDLGNVEDFSEAHWGVLAAKAKQVWNADVSKWTASQIRRAGGIVTGLSPADIEKLKLDDLDGITSVGGKGKWSNAKAISGFKAFKGSYGKTLGNVTGTELKLLGHMACGATSEDIKQFTPRTYCTAASGIGALDACETIQLTAYAAHAKHSSCHGEVATWSSSSVQDIGNVIGGIGKDGLAALTKAHIGIMKPQTFSKIPTENVAGFTKEQLGYLDSTQAAAFSQEQLDALPAELKALVTEIATGVQDNGTDNNGGDSGCGLPEASFIVILTTFLAAILRI